jgi:peptidoglycan hydrolase CwlO-like protein
MLRIATLLTIVACLTIIGCQPPEGMAGVTKEEFDALKTQVETLQTDIANLQASIESLTESYNAHIEKHHKGGTTAPMPPKPKSGGVKAPTQK